MEKEGKQWFTILNTVLQVLVLLAIRFVDGRVHEEDGQNKVR